MIMSVMASRRWSLNRFELFDCRMLGGVGYFKNQNAADFDVGREGRFRRNNAYASVLYVTEFKDLNCVAAKRPKIVVSARSVYAS